MDVLSQVTWRPGIGDPTVMGWLTVAAYAAAAALAFAAARSAPERLGARGGEHAAWLLVAMVMLLLCVNKQLDLQSLLTDLGRIAARRQGWYWNRREVLGWAAYGIGSTFLVGATVLAVLFPRFWRRHILLGVGLVFLLGFIAIRALSLHQFDAVINHSVYGIRANALLELSGITLVALAALNARARSHLRPRPHY